VCVASRIAGAPVYETAIDEQVPTEQVLAASLDAYSPAEIDPIAFETLSKAEQTDIAEAVASPQGVYLDRGCSDDGTQFTYRNDVVTQCFVSY